MAMLDQVIANQKKNDEGDSVYEHIEKKEIHKGTPTAPPEIHVTRNIPAGTGTDKIAMGPDGKPTDVNAYRAELEKLVHSLVWATEDGRAQRDAYEKADKHRKDKGEMIDATKTAFMYTFLAREPRGDRMLLKFRMDPNPAYKPTSRATAIFAKVQGVAWIDEQANQLAKVEVEVTDVQTPLPGLVVHPEYCLFRRARRQAESLARIRIEPRALEVNALGRLDGQVALVRLAQLVPGHADEPAVHVHELRHANLLTVTDWG